MKAKLAALGCDEAKVTVVLEEASKLGVNDAETAAELTAEDWTRCGLLLAPARKLVRQLTAPAPEEPVAAAAAAAVPTALKPLPDDTSFLKMLVVGGVPKMKAEDAVAAVRVAIAERLGVFELEETILTRIEERAVSLRAQVPPVFYAIEDSKTRKTHPEILRA
ncbi:MAG: hypothetical protein Q8P82_00035, partial [bacterium]|nr:hypothetical protein [bacterium]